MLLEFDGKDLRHLGPVVDGFRLGPGLDLGGFVRGVALGSGSGGMGIRRKKGGSNLGSKFQAVSLT